MTDRLGRLSIRSAQMIIVVTILISAIVFALIQLRLAIIPVLLMFIKHGPLLLDDIDLDMDTLRDSAIEFATIS